MREITVLTPSYNRAYILNKLYKSLVNQTNKNFLWMIVDDGSKDGTDSLVKKWKNEKKIEILYIYKQNGGKHTALNVGISQIESELTFIVDSDDYLAPEAIDTILKDYSKCNEELGGLCYLKQSSDGHYLSNKTVQKDGIIESYCECRYGRSIDGDMAEVWLTKYLKDFPFAEFKGEKFLSEDTVWIRISGEHKLKFFNKAIYIADYLEGGLTKNRRELNKTSPRGCMYRGELQLRVGLPLKYRIRAMLYYIVYGRFAGYHFKNLFKNSEHKSLFFVCFPAGMFLYYKWR